MNKVKDDKLKVTFPNINVSQSEVASPPKSRKKNKWLEFVAIASIPLVLVLGNSMLIPVLPQMQNELNISQFQASLTITLFSVAAGIFIPILGYLSDRFGRKAIMIPSLIVYGGAGILAGFGAVWGSYAVVISARAIQGFGAAGTAPIAMALVGDLYKGGTESQALGLVEASNGTGKVVSPILGSLLALIVWYAAFFAFPAFCLLALIAIIMLIKEPEKEKAEMNLSTYIQTIITILKEKGRWLISSFFVGAIALFTLFGVLFYLSEILEKNPYEVKGVLKGLVLAIPLMGMVVTSYVTGSIIKKNGKLIRLFSNIGLAIASSSLVTTIFINQNIYVFIGLLTLSSIGTGMVLPCLNTMITGSVSKEQRGMITSLYSSLRFFGVAFGPPLFSWLMEWHESHDLAVFLSVSLLSLIAWGLVFFLIKPDKTLNTP